jgi:hypothetical protein
MLAWDRIGGGDTVYLRAGTYTLDLVCSLVGDADHRITIKPYNNETVIISGDFNSTGSCIDFVDIIFTTGNTDRTIASDPDYYTYPNLDFVGAGNRLINCTLHDAAALGVWDPASLFYGCITYNQGIVTPVRGRGHSLYVQNHASNPNRKTIKHSIFGRSAYYGLHGFATTEYLSKFDVIECVLLPGSNHLIGSQGADDDIVFSGNHTCGSLQLGYGSHDHTGITMSNNVLYNPAREPLLLKAWTSGNISNNIFVADGEGEQNILYYAAPVGARTITIDNNTYYNRTGRAVCFHEDVVGGKTLAQWQSVYGYDPNSTITLDGSAPADSAHVYPNEYAAISKRKGLVVIWNWSGANTVNVDLSDIAIDAGQEFSILNTQNPLVDVATETMPENKIVTFAMTGHSIAGVTGWADPPSTFPAFGAFVLEKV